MWFYDKKMTADILEEIKVLSNNIANLLRICSRARTTHKDPVVDLLDFVRYAICNIRA